MKFHVQVLRAATLPNCYLQRLRPYKIGTRAANITLFEFKFCKIKLTITKQFKANFLQTVDKRRQQTICPHLPCPYGHTIIFEKSFCNKTFGRLQSASAEPFLHLSEWTTISPLTANVFYRQSLMKINSIKLKGGL